jgi:hypothetical protein
MLVYNANLRSITAGDTYPARYLPFAILHYHTIFLGPIAEVAAQGRGDTAYWLLHRPGGRVISLYPLVVPVLIAPLYVPAILYLQQRGWTDARMEHVARLMEKLVASFLAALSVSLLYLLLLRRAKASLALLLTLAYAFGTTTWMISSQALWQHGMGELLLIGALLLITRPSSMPRVLALGLLLGLVASNRPPDAILGAALGIYGLFWAGRRLAPLLAASSAFPMVVVMFYNLWVAGNVLGGYGVGPEGVVGKGSFFRHDLLLGVSGLLASPTRGLLVFSPFLLFLVLAWRYRPQIREERWLTLAMSVAAVIQLLLYAKSDWRSGLSWGPRYLTDLLPFLIWMLVPVVAALRGVGRVCFLMAVGVSIIIEAIGAFSYSPSFDVPIYADDRGPLRHDMRPAFRWGNSPILTSIRRGLAPAELLTVVLGTIDGTESAGRPVSAITSGQEVIVTGWALAGHATPWQVAVNIDGGQYVACHTFSDRPDVRGSLHETSPAGWRLTLNTAGLTPGVHHLTAMAWASEKGEGSYIGGQALTVIAPASKVAFATVAGSRTAREGPWTAEEDLNASFREAVARLREHQQAPGYWLTYYTSEPRFHQPHAEMNTFLTALLVDLVNPVAAASGLEPGLQRARQHLTSQIESGGLVRYHGLPDAPGIGTLGCAITPDTDNTALVWRLAPAPDRERLTTALATIERYRTRDGLYRTWLAPRGAYQCLDPGSDPDPADVAIQMHLLMLLSQVRPAAGRTLCEALSRHIDEDRIWVYYRKTPLVPILRLTALQRAGCELKLPESRMRTELADQQIWVSVVRLLAGPAVTQASPPDPVLMRALLRELARDGFALVRMHPPLLYHNDLTATVSRYYWSEDAGYALWLRLYDEYRRLNPAA